MAVDLARNRSTEEKVRQRARSDAKFATDTLELACVKRGCITSSPQGGMTLVEEPFKPGFDNVVEGDGHYSPRLVRRKNSEFYVPTNL